MQKYRIDKRKFYRKWCYALQHDTGFFPYQTALKFWCFLHQLDYASIKSS